jgi:hypothetical protein
MNDYPLDMSPGFPYATNRPGIAPTHFSTSDVIQAEGQLFGIIDYMRTENSSMRKTHSWTFEEETEINSYCVWFDAYLMDDISYSGKPGEQRPNQVYGHLVFPLAQPTTIPAGATLRLKLEAIFVDGQPDYIWNWGTTIVNREGATLQRYRQSTIVQQVFQLDKYRAQQGQHDEHEHPLNDEGALMYLVLQGVITQMEDDAIVEHIRTYRSDIEMSDEALKARILELRASYGRS